MAASEEEAADEWERCEEPPAPLSPTAARLASANAALDAPPSAQRRRTAEDPPAWHDADPGNGDEEEFLQALVETVEDPGLDAFLATFDGAVAEVPSEPPAADVSIDALLRDSIAEIRQGPSQQPPPRERAHNFAAITCSTYHRKKGGRPSAWSEVETQRFYAVLRQYGPNFSLLETFFPGRSRQELKSKYNRIDRSNPGFMTDLLRDHCPIDPELYAQWKEKSEQHRLKAQEREQERALDALEMSVNETELLAELGGLSSPTPLDEPLGHTSPPPPGDGEAEAEAEAVLAVADRPGAGEEDGLEGFTDDLAHAGFDGAGDLPFLPTMPEDAVEYYD